MNIPKTLIYKPINYLKPTGGPAGYLFNLYEQIKNEPNIFFLPEEKFSVESKLAKKLPRCLTDYVRAKKLEKLVKSKKSSPVNLNDYEIIHFHQTTDMYLLRDQLKDYHGKVILTSHSPCAFHIELSDRLSEKGKITYKKILDKLEIIDSYAFQRADYVLFPCEEAEEPYFHTWKNYLNVRDKSKYIYVPTGIKECKIKESSELIRKRYGISEGAYVVCFVGRHNSIKGYDILKEIATNLLSNNKEIYFLIAGAKGPISPLIDNHWIEVGWTDDPYSIINAADVFLLPNKETYFDLIALEVLSLGKSLIASQTGGNKYLGKLGFPSLMLYSTITDAENLIVKHSMLSKATIKYNEQESLRLFNKYFTCEVFAHNYLTALCKISNKEDQL